MTGTYQFLRFDELVRPSEQKLVLCERILNALKESIIDHGLLTVLAREDGKYEILDGVARSKLPDRQKIPVLVVTLEKEDKEEYLKLKSVNYKP